MTTDAVFEAFYDDDLTRGFLHSHSYTGNPLACRAAVAVLDTLEDEKILERNRRLAQWMNRRLEGLRGHPRVRSLRNAGMIWAFDLADEDRRAGAAFYRRAIEAGVLLRPLGNTVYWMPPYAVGESEMDFLADRVEQILAS
jgi:adenosylmethionine-8-amino-7-oxononanoate aminotransferase